ncbi:CocE/NonD family hydrolase [Neolewinella lacunae]|uniref:CocE/NonD family hydrolase n=1 Tax=Neolewinella lacunae TaxID=1517758 RepID=A0A923T5V7_9BACT|nr:CocE/NonD family hydrolase [Neolewinella lacunae]MBC6992740.1 CocE/NonD family hydrolase [Neolewinella lacunae]MDN3635984.1 CocE/NonD family hydrolase [Neolewinella lacunae]
MSFRLSLLLLVLLHCTCGSAQSSAAYLKLAQVAHIEQKNMVTMRDGVRLCTDIYRPKTDARVPIILSRTPYQMNAWVDGEERTRTYERAYEAVVRGYAYVEQNERGRYYSEGEWDILGVPLTDGYDAFTWLAEQRWSNGNIGLYGCSSTAEWQMAVASLGHPALKAMVPMGYGAGVGRIGKYMEQGNWYRGGAQQMLFTAWLYSVQHDPQRPRLAAGTSREDLLRLQRFYDMSPEYPSVDWAEGLRTLPVQDIIRTQHGPQGIYEEMITRQPNDPKWYQGGLYHDDMPFNVPTFWFTSWYDVSISPNLALFNHVRQNATSPAVREQQHLVIAPTLHCAYTRATANTVVGERNVGDARLDYDELIYGWFDKHLKGTESSKIKALPQVQFYTMGSNVWQTSTAWPPPAAVMTTYYLDSDGRANTRHGNGRLVTKAPAKDQPDAFVYDPMDPVPSYGGNVCCTGNAVKGGSFDQRVMENRNDILVYTTEPFAEGVELSGFIETTLYVSSDAKDTDFTVKLIDVYPDGTAYNLDETIQRVRYREGYDREVFMEKDKVYKVELTPMSTSNYFQPGHSIRIEVSSSNFPRFERNLNTGGKNYDEKEGVVAKNKVHHSVAYPSAVRLPLLR